MRELFCGITKGNSILEGGKQTNLEKARKMDGDMIILQASIFTVAVSLRIKEMATELLSY